MDNVFQHKPLSIYVDRDVWNKYKRVCSIEGVGANRQLENLLKEYIAKKNR